MGSLYAMCKYIFFYFFRCKSHFKKLFIPAAGVVERYSRWYTFKICVLHLLSVAVRSFLWDHFIKCYHQLFGKSQGFYFEKWVSKVLLLVLKSLGLFADPLKK